MHSTTTATARRREATRHLASLRVLLLASLAFGYATPSFAAPDGCTAGYSDSTVLLDVAFETVARDAMPTSVTRQAPIVIKCARSVGTPALIRWTLTPRSITFTMINGSTPGADVSTVGRRFSLATNVLEVNDGVSGYTPKYQADAGTTAMLTNLSSKLSAGQYSLRQVLDVSQETCRPTGNHLSCKSDGVIGQYSANYNLNVVETLTVPVTPPATGSGTTSPAPRKGPTPNPWTVRGYAAKHRCAVCDELRSGD
jgi:hypothetical protein